MIKNKQLNAKSKHITIVAVVHLIRAVNNENSTMAVSAMTLNTHQVVIVDDSNNELFCTHWICLIISNDDTPAAEVILSTFLA
jgi:hypothetical protein